MDIISGVVCGIFCLVYLLSVILILYVFVKYVVPYMNHKNEIRDKEIKNKKYEIFKSIDIDYINSAIDKYIEENVNRYIAYKFMSKKKMYISAEEGETMIRDITKLCCIQISELYIFYINMITSISNEEELVAYINNRVKNACIDSITSYNGAMDIDF
jgi:hypothetical protein